MISASSFWMRFAEVVSCLELKDLDSLSLALRSLEVEVVPELDPAPEAIFDGSKLLGNSEVSEIQSSNFKLLN